MELYVLDVYKRQLLDVMLPDMSGIEICKFIRQQFDQIGVIMLTAKGQEEDKLEGFISGADDYMVKPFSIKELLVRVSALIRRVKKDENKFKSNEIISDELCDFIAYFEGCILKAYYCSSGILTIGIGCTRKEVTSLGTITKERAYEEFKKDILVYAKAMDNLCGKYNVNLNNYEREALISFAFNCGIKALEQSTLWYNITNGIRDKDIITENFLRFVKSSSGKVLEGLIKRRKTEAELFLTDKSTFI